MTTSDCAKQYPTLYSCYSRCAAATAAAAAADDDDDNVKYHCCYSS